MTNNNEDPFSYSKIINVLFAFLVALIGYVWNNSQKQIESGLVKVDELTKSVSLLQTQVVTLMFKVGSLKDQVEIQNRNIESIRNDPYYSRRAASPRFPRR